MFGMAAMRKIHSRHIHTRFEQPVQNPRIGRCRTNGADDFGMSKTHLIRAPTIGIAISEGMSLAPSWRRSPLPTFRENSRRRSFRGGEESLFLDFGYRAGRPT